MMLTVAHTINVPEKLQLPNARPEKQKWKSWLGHFQGPAPMDPAEPAQIWSFPSLSKLSWSYVTNTKVNIFPPRLILRNGGRYQTLTCTVLLLRQGI